MVWEGYLFRDATDRLRLGWPVLARSVGERPAHVVTGAFAERLAPLESRAKGDYVFLHTSLQRRPEEALKGVPRVLVRLGGVVVQEDPSTGVGSSSGRELRMINGCVLTVEFVPEEWLRHWAITFRRSEADVRGGPIESPRDAEVVLTRALRSLAALRAMREAPGIQESERALVQRIDPRARLVTHFRSRTEWRIQRRILEANEQHQLGLGGLDDLGPLPPSSAELIGWFLDADSKDAFLKSVTESWSGSLEILHLSHYVSKGAATTYASTDLETLRQTWTEETFHDCQASTARALNR
jgi:hypothetical protein